MSNFDQDRALGFLVPERNARGRLVRLGPTLEAVLAHHGYPPVIEKLLAEALVLAALLGTLLKDEGSQLTMQAQTEAGPVSLLVADYKDGAVRGYVQFDEEKLALCPETPTLMALFGKGYLAITFDQAVTNERYQGIVPLEGAGLCDAVEHYFAQSEQIPSLITLGISPDRRVAGGMILQHLPEGEVGRERLHVRHDHPEWEHMRIMGASLQVEEMTDPALPLETLIWRLFHDEGELRVTGGASLSKGCRCTVEHIRSVLTRFPDDDRAEMADDTGQITVDCSFCAKNFHFQLSELAG
ncbi:MAG TPA: Hsp33 family molecular chaperone HslO [Chakrabartia sp.]|nr:Hsp33 family molecular chaperone HslO [Chakrabartia sp.]